MRVVCCHMAYEISSRDYLERACVQLDGKGESTLFYAAFELRCGIEARMKEYLEAQQHLARKKRQGWQIAKLGRHIESAFKLGDRKARLNIRQPDTNEVLAEFLYTPVTRSLRRKGERLGELLHHATKYHAPEDEYWPNLRKQLDDTRSALEEATSGRLLGPVLLHPNRKSMEMKVELLTSKEQTLLLELAKGRNILLDVSYE